MDFSIIKPELNKFLKSKKFSIKNNFVYEAHSTDYQPKKVLEKLVQNNFKFLKVGPELTYNFTRSLFFMNRLEKKFLKKKNSNFKKNLYLSMKKNKIYWKDYYKKNKNNMLLNSKLDRSRYYLNSKDVVHSLKLLKQNINSINKKKIKYFLRENIKKDYFEYYNEKLSNYDNIKLIFISMPLSKYYEACGY